MSPSSGCPSDRSELVAVLEDRAGEVLRTHVAECERCRLEVRELQGALDLVIQAPEAPPSERVRREAVSYARSQVRGPVTGRAPWNAPVAAIFAAVLAALFGELAHARMTAAAPQITSPEPWTFVLAAAWSVGLFLYVAPGGSTFRRKIVAHALAGVAAFTVLVLAIPIPETVELCAAWAYGPGPLTPGRAVWTYIVVASLYAAVPVFLVSRLRSADLTWSQACWAAGVFAAFAGPLLLIQAAVHPSGAVQAGIWSLACGAWIAERLGSRR